MSGHMVMTGYGATARVLEDIDDERRRQDAKWGEQNHDLTVWLTVLAEEVGEAGDALPGAADPLAISMGRAALAILHYRAAAGRAENVEGDTDPDAWLAKARNEFIQTAAVAVAIVEFIDRGMQPTHPIEPTPGGTR
jgi:hypothetical protein